MGRIGRHQHFKTADGHLYRAPVELALANVRPAHTEHTTVKAAGDADMAVYGELRLAGAHAFTQRISSRIRRRISNSAGSGIWLTSPFPSSLCT
jgi:hypothetical protein